MQLYKENRECRFASNEYCSFQIVNSIGVQWNSRTAPDQRLDILKQQIEALNSVPAGYPFEIVVIDDGSNRETYDFLTRCYAEGKINILILNNTRKIGNCFAKNLALSVIPAHEHAAAGLSRNGNIFKQTGEQSYSPRFIALAENDVVPIRDNWLLELIEVLDANADIGFVNSIEGPFSEGDYHKLLRTREWRGQTLEYRRQIPGSFFLCETALLQKFGNYTQWDFRTRGQAEGYNRESVPAEYQSLQWFGSWDEEFCMRFARGGRFGVNVKPAKLEHRIGFKVKS